MVIPCASYVPSHMRRSAEYSLLERAAIDCQNLAVKGVQNIHSLSVLRLIFKPLQKEVCRNIHSLSRQDASGGLSEQVTIPTCENSLTPCERLDCKSALCARRYAEYSFLERTAIDCQNLAERGVSEYSFLERAAL